MNEIWADIKGFEGLYQISNLGRVKSIARYSQQNHFLPERILRINHSQGGYCDVCLYKNGKRTHKKLHRLVADAFIPNPRNLNEIDHIDTNKDNNCVDNLRWCTHKENYENPLTKQQASEIHKGYKWKESQYEKSCVKINVFKDNKLLHTFKSYKDLDNNSKKIFGITLWNVYVRRIINDKSKTYHGYSFTTE